MNDNVISLTPEETMKAQISAAMETFRQLSQLCETQQARVKLHEADRLQFREENARLRMQFEAATKIAGRLQLECEQLRTEVERLRLEQLRTEVDNGDEPC